jgi:hypothetical protein
MGTGTLSAISDTIGTIIMSNGVSLEKLMEVRFSELDKQLADIKSALNHLSQNMVSSARFESKVHSIKELQAIVDDQQEHISRIEHFQSAIKYIGGLLITLLMAIVIAWAAGLI